MQSATEADLLRPLIHNPCVKKFIMYMNILNMFCINVIYLKEE